MQVVRVGSATHLMSPYGTFSWYHPNRPYTGFAWDAHSAATLLIKREPKSVLILGLGGGTIARQIRLLAPSSRITGVEIDGAVLEAARQHFRLDAWDVDVIHTASQAYLRRTRRSFDVILDDMWPPERHDSRPVRAHDRWAALVRSRLAPDGVYSVTAFRRSEDPNDIPQILDSMDPVFDAICEVRPRDGETTVLAAGADLLTGAAAHARRRRLPPAHTRRLRHVRYCRVR